VAAVPKIAEWLAQLGMSEYAQRFAENRIDVSILRDLTDQDLKDLGIVLGDRRKMLRAIADLDQASRVAPAVAIGPTSPGSAERRHVTVLFSDLVGSTALSTRLDPEDLREVIAAYQNGVADIVRRLGGFVARYLGDGVLAYFGWPQAHEDDAERSVRAGLELIAAVAGLKAHAGLQTRVGIATGLVVVGDLAETGEGRERGIVGETPNLAARLQTLAEPNTVVIAEGTRRLLGHLFELEDLGARELKGIPGLTQAWAVLRPRSVEGRFEALHAGNLGELVGRDEEREWLRRRWVRAKTGDGQLVLLSGEAGIGKSRLTAALLDDLATEPHARLRYFCSPQHTDSALYPIIGQLERAARLAHDDPPQARLDKLDALLAQTSTSIRDRALLAEMLSLPNDGRYPAADLTPPERRQRTLDALLSGWEAVTRPHPLVMIFEDAHWADPTSLELLSRAVDRVRTLPVLLIVTFRPEFAPPWIGRPHVTALTLNRLAERDIGALIDRLGGNTLIPASIRQDIIERTDGIPLFVEEMTKAVLEAEDPRAAERTVATAPSPARAVPASLQALVDGAARSARRDQGGSSDRGGDRPGIFPCADGGGGGQAGSGADIGARPSNGRRFAVPARCAALCDVSVQACAGAGRRLRHFAARAATRAARPDRANARRSVSRDCREPARAAGASLQRGRPDRKSRKSMGQGGPAIAGALGAGRSRSPAHACHRADRELAQHAGAASRRDHTSGRADSPALPPKGTRRGGNQGRRGAGTSADRTSRGSR
jgi:class 3 adenylate cyclase